MTKEILPCPFCGSKNIAFEGIVFLNDVPIEGAVNCINCDSNSGYVMSERYESVENETIDVWNTRSLEAAKQVLKEHGLIAVPEEPTEAMFQKCFSGQLRIETRLGRKQAEIRYSLLIEEAKLIGDEK